MGTGNNFRTVRRFVCRKSDSSGRGFISGSYFQFRLQPHCAVGSSKPVGKGVRFDSGVSLNQFESGFLCTVLKLLPREGLRSGLRFCCGGSAMRARLRAPADRSLGWGQICNRGRWPRQRRSGAVNGTEKRSPSRTFVSINTYFDPGDAKKHRGATFVMRVFYTFVYQKIGIN